MSSEYCNFHACAHNHPACAWLIEMFSEKRVCACLYVCLLAYLLKRSCSTLVLYIRLWFYTLLSPCLSREQQNLFPGAARWNVPHLIIRLIEHFSNYDACFIIGILNQSMPCIGKAPWWGYFRLIQQLTSDIASYFDLFCPCGLSHNSLWFLCLLVSSHGYSLVLLSLVFKSH